jgi:hypothetical protein
MYLTKKYLPRRAVLRGLGVLMTLPLLDAMVPAGVPSRKTAALPKPRFVAIEMVHGAAGSTPWGRERNYWSPSREGPGFEFTPTLQDLERFRPYITIVSDTDLQNAVSLSGDEDGPMADHARSVRRLNRQGVVNGSFIQ